MTPDDTRHGTRRGYNAGCDCDDCKRARESALSGESARMETTPASAPTRNRGLTHPSDKARRGYV